MAKPGSENPIEIPAELDADPGPWSWSRVVRHVKCFGPAAILASMSVGAGETIVVVRTGAWARYDLLWVILLSCLAKGVFITYMLGRYTAISGEHIGQRLCRLPGPRGWLLLSIVALEMIFAPLVWVAIARPCGNLLHFLVDVDFFAGFASGEPSAAANEIAYSILFIAAALAASLKLDYRLVERQQIVICAILVLGTLIGTVLIGPDLREMLDGTLLRMGQLPETTPAWAPADAREFPWLNLATVFAYVGGSVTGYIAYANWVGVRGWGLTAHSKIDSIRERARRSERIDYLPDDPAQVRRVRRLVSPLRWDLGVGALVLFFVTAAFMASGAAVLYEQESSFAGWSLLTDQVSIWRGIHPWLVPIYYVTVIVALWGTLTALPEVYSRVSHEFFRAIWPRWRLDHFAVHRIIVLTLFVGSSVILWTDLQFDVLTQVGGFLLANFSVAVVAIAAFYLNHALPPAYRVRRWVFVCAVISTLILSVASSMSLYGLVRKMSDAPNTASQVEEEPR